MEADSVVLIGGRTELRDVSESIATVLGSRPLTADPDSGLRLIADLRPKVVIVDFDCVNDGFVLVSAIQEELGGDVEIIVTGMCPSQEFLFEVHMLGCTCFLVKPLERSDLEMLGQFVKRLLTEWGRKSM
jgi:DNA-binding NarL/FixJ family response regulator